jgi:hypothetical protein
MIPLAHIFGIPVEETLGSYGPALLVTVGTAVATLHARMSRRSQRRRGAAARDHDGAPDTNPRTRDAEPGVSPVQRG